MAKRGRPEGHKLSMESRQKISMTKTGQLHEHETKKKISESLLEYFKTPEGIAQRERTSLFLTGFWASDDGYFFRETLGQSMSDYYNEHFKD
jgi:uncharacterized protein YjiK